MKQRRWYRWLPWLLIGTGIVWLTLLGFHTQVSGKRLWLIGAVYDAGKVKRNRVISHRVWIWNPSLRTVNIRSEPSCGCTVAELPSNQATPLNGFPIVVQVETWGLPLGLQEKVVTLEASCGKEWWLEEVRIRFEVVP
ncbi:MAG: hypothetical protein QXI60_06260 [Thermofilaceae archaeon]